MYVKREARKPFSQVNGSFSRLRRQSFAQSYDVRFDIRFHSGKCSVGKSSPKYSSQSPVVDIRTLRQHGNASRIVHGRNNGRLSVFRQDLSIKLALAEFTFETVDLIVRGGGRETQMIWLNTNNRTLT